MSGRIILIKSIIFFVVFTILFFGIRTFNLLPSEKLIQNNASLPWLFSAIELIFSIISGFVIQSKWATWNELIDATHGELTSLRHLSILSYHFPDHTGQAIRKAIVEYLTLIIKESEEKINMNQRSEEIDKAMFQLEESVFNINYKQDSNIGTMSFDLVRKIIEYREKRLQNILHRLPLGVKVFIIFTTFASIFTSLFIGVTSLFYDFLFTSIIALTSFGIYLLIDDLDNPYRPGQWHLSIEGYKRVLEEVRTNK